MTSAGKISSTIYSATNNISSYFHLKDINEGLQRRNANLELEVLYLRKQLQIKNDSICANDSVGIIPNKSQYNIRIAHVINNSIFHSHNYITIDKGETDGIKAEMGVIDQNGVVGIVNITGKEASRIISLLNPDLRLSCKIKGSENFGSLIWDGKAPNEAILEELPRHAIANIGDTIVTSGYSAVFPAGIPVGIVTERENEDDDNFYALRVKLLTDFSQLSTVMVIDNLQKEDIRQLEKEDSH